MDSNRNVRLDASEFGPQATSTVMDPLATAALTDETFDPLTEGSLDRGWSGSLPLSSPELNTTENGEKLSLIHISEPTRR